MIARITETTCLIFFGLIFLSLSKAPSTLACHIFSGSEFTPIENLETQVVWRDGESFDFNSFSTLAIDLIRTEVNRLNLKSSEFEEEIISRTLLVLARLSSGDLKKPWDVVNMRMYVKQITATEVERYRKQVHRDKSKFESDIGSPTVRVPDPLVMLELREAIEGAITKLVINSDYPQRNLQILNMYFFDGYGKNEIGTLLDLNPRTVGVFIHRSKEKLARYLQEQGFKPEAYFRE